MGYKIIGINEEKMKKVYPWMIASLILAAGCQRKSNGVWDENTTEATAIHRASSLWSEEERFAGPAEEEFIPLQEEDLKLQFADGAIPQSTILPGEEGSGVPGIDQFQAPNSLLLAVFRSVFFNTDDHLIRGKEHLAAIGKMGSYLKEHPNMYVFVEGHCDERGPEAYNLALGARRANTVRTMLVEKGADANQIYTISYGKERPEELGHTQEAWRKNRRAQFKIYEKR